METFKTNMIKISKLFSILLLSFAFFMFLGNARSLRAKPVCVIKNTAMPQYTKTDCESPSVGGVWRDEHDSTISVICYSLKYVKTKDNGTNDYAIYTMIECSPDYQYRRSHWKINRATRYTDSTYGCNNLNCYRLSYSTGRISAGNKFELVRIDGQTKISTSCYDSNGKLIQCSSASSNTKCYNKDKKLIQCNKDQEKNITFVSSPVNNKEAGTDTYTIEFKDTSTEVKLASYSPNYEMFRTVDKIKEVVKNIILPIIWASLGLLLGIKGAILGTQIVKASDEPQVRQEKINSLKYLVIGVAIAFGVSFAATPLLEFFKQSLIK
jgi:transposase